MSQEFKSGFWIKDGNNFVNIENVLPDASLEDINIYEFDSNFNLRTISKRSFITLPLAERYKDQCFLGV